MCVCVSVYVYMSECMHVSMEGRKDGWIPGWMGGCICLCNIYMYICIIIFVYDCLRMSRYIIYIYKLICICAYLISSSICSILYVYACICPGFYMCVTISGNVSFGGVANHSKLNRLGVFPIPLIDP